MQTRIMTIKILPWLCWILFLVTLALPVISLTEASPVTGKIVMLFSIPTEGITVTNPVVFKGWLATTILLLQAPVYAGLTFKGLFLLLINISILSLALAPFPYFSNKWTQVIAALSCLISAVFLLLLISQPLEGIRTEVGMYLWVIGLAIYIATRLILLVKNRGKNA